jgi:hypothetical protein
MLRADQAFLNSGIDVLNGTTAVFAITKLKEEYVSLLYDCHYYTIVFSI